MERLNLDNYNSDDYENLSDNMETTPTLTTEVKTTIKKDPPLAPPAMTVTVQLEDKPVAEELYKHRRIRNQKQCSGANVSPIVAKNSRATTTTTPIAISAT